MLGDEELSVNHDGWKCLSKEGDERELGRRTGRKMPALGMYPPLSCLLHCTSVVKVAHLISSGLQKGNSNPRGRQEFASLELQLFVLILTSPQGFLGSGFSSF